jgi:hypothetical protein
VDEPTFSQAEEAAVPGRGGTSFQDRLCLVAARDGGWACFTNDGALRRACEDAQIACLWGLEAMLRLVKTGHLTPARADRVASAIVDGNPRMTAVILRRFRRQVGRPTR